MPAYSFHWARCRVTELVAKYTRATEIVCRMLNITTTDLAWYLANADPIFPKIRSMIHQIDHCIEVGPTTLTDVQFMDIYRKKYLGKSIAHDEPRIDNRIQKVMIEEQVLKGVGGDGLPTIISNQPFSSAPEVQIVQKVQGADRGNEQCTHRRGAPPTYCLSHNRS